MSNCQTSQLPPYRQKKSFKYFMLKKKKGGPFAWFGVKTINGVWSLSSIA